jgi:hypothetical protein
MCIGGCDKTATTDTHNPFGDSTAILKKVDPLLVVAAQPQQQTT